MLSCFINVINTCTLRVRLHAGEISGHPAAPRASEGDHPAGGGGAGHPPESDAVTAAADPRS